MNVLKRLESVQPNKPYHGFNKLPIGYHEICCFRAVKNKFGKKGEGSSKTILVELDDQVVFLPQYFWQKINEKDISDLNELIVTGEHIYLFFGGKQEQGG